MLILTLIAEYTRFIQLVTQRYHLVNMLPFALTVTAGLYGLYSFRRWLGLFVLLWIAAGVGFQMDGNWRTLVPDRLPEAPLPPWPALSREATRADVRPVVIGYRLKRGVLERKALANTYTQKHYYFDRHQIDLKLFHTPDVLYDYVRHHAIPLPSIWLVYQTAAAMPHEAADLQTMLAGLNYQLCDATKIAIDTVILQYASETLNCPAP